MQIDSLGGLSATSLWNRAAVLDQVLIAILFNVLNTAPFSIGFYQSVIYFQQTNTISTIIIFFLQSSYGFKQSLLIFQQSPNGF